MTTGQYIKYGLLGIFAVIAALMVIKNFSAIKKFVTEVWVELKKVSWSTKKEVVDSTWVVIISSLFLGVFIGSTDFVLSKLIGLIIE